MTIQQAFDLAVQHHQAGQLQRAEQIYRQILAQQPGHSDALHMVGLIAYQMGRNDIAVDLIRQAIALNANFPQAHSNLGLALMDAGKLEEAIAAFRQAIALDANFPEAYINLSNALREKGQPEEAIAACRQAIALKPNYAEAYNNLGNALKDSGKQDEAIAAFRQAIALKPNYAEACNNLGVVLRDAGLLEEAIAACRQAIALNSSYAEAYNTLGVALKDHGQLEEAGAAFRQAIALKPSYAEAHNNLGVALKDRGQLDEAIAAHRRAITLKPNYHEAYCNLGLVFREKSQLDEAVAACRQAIAIKADYGEAYNNLGNALKDQGQLDEAIVAYQKAVALDPDNAAIDSNLVYTLHFHPAYDGKAIAEEHRRWNQRHAEPLRQFIRPHANDRSPDRRLKMGYVSPDFREHPVGRFLLPLLACHDRERFEVFAYAQLTRQDALTQQLRSHTDQWRSITGFSDERAAQVIRDDRIDILVDLTMHMANNRMLVFARKPAPVQVTYLAYCSTTGLSTMDYRFSDPYLDPPGHDQSIYTEQTLHLLQTYWCYQPVSNPAIGSLPALKANYITFGSLNNFCKVTELTLTIWASLLQAVPKSQLLLHAGEGSHRLRVTELFQRLGVDPDRLRFVRLLPTSEYLQLYQQIDIALDPFPYGGGTTSCDALWMGVPVVSLAGETAVGRGGLSILSNIGLPDLVASTPDQYVQIAAALAGDLPRLTDFRATLRQRMKSSPLMEAPRFARNVESAYREMWHKWCAANSPNN